MKNLQVFLFLLFLLMHSTGCEKQEFGGIDSYYFYIPNVISFDDQDNNIFYVQDLSDNPVEFMVEVMEIFDRYGNPMYKAEQFPANDSNYGWDGTFEENHVESGTFSYSIKISDGTGTLLLVGEFTVIG